MTETNPTPPPTQPEIPAYTPTVYVTPEEYPTGAIKQDPATKSSAVRTNIFDPEGLKDWGVMTVDRGGHYANWDEVKDWTDMEPKS